jgi:hypothetical protein
MRGGISAFASRIIAPAATEKHQRSGNNTKKNPNGL